MRDHIARNFLIYDLVFWTALYGLVIVGAEYWWGRETIEKATAPNRQALYIAIASAAGSLLGFIVTAASIMIAFSTMPQFKMIRDTKHFRSIFRIYLHTMWWLAITTICALMGLMIDTSVTAELRAMYVIGWITVTAGVRVYRCIWIMSLAMKTLLETPESAYPKSL